MDNISSTILSQYAGSPVMTQMINQWNLALDLSTNEQLFLKDIWDVSTASGIGLDIWGRIVGVSRYLYVPPGSIKYLGFSENTNALPFNNAPFYAGVDATKTFALDDDIFRQLIMAKAYCNISTCTVYDINYVLNMLFSSYGDVYCIETDSMKLQIVLDFNMEPWQFAIIVQSGVIPIPAGVSLITVDSSGIVINDLVIVV
jgi:hypothetical protein